MMHEAALDNGQASPIANSNSGRNGRLGAVLIEAQAVFVSEPELDMRRTWLAPGRWYRFLHPFARSSAPLRKLLSAPRRSIDRQVQEYTTEHFWI